MASFKPAVIVTPEIMQTDLDFIRKWVKKYPWLWRSRWGGLMGWMKARFRKTLQNGGGMYGVRPFTPKSVLTVALHGNKLFGGGFPRGPLAKSWFGPRNEQRIGIYDRVPAFRAFGESLQTSESRRMTWRERAYLACVPSARYDPLRSPVYNRPGRPFVADFAEYNFPQMVHELRHRVEKVVSSEASIQKAKSKLAVADAKRAARAAGKKRKR